jgi:peptidoglycan/LPS O-acetylase OafA/YrhL
MVLFSLFIHSISFNNYNISIKNKALNYLGKISYGIYVYHVLALNFTVFLFLKFESLRNLPPNIIVIFIYSLTFAITILIAHLSFKYFESYFLKLKHKFRV